MNLCTYESCLPCYGSCWRSTIGNQFREIPLPSHSHHLHVINDSAEDNFIPDNDGAADVIDETPCTQPQLGKEKTLELRNGRSVPLIEDSNSGPDGSLKEVIFAELIDGLKIELNAGRAIPLNNLVEIYKTRMTQNGALDPRTDKALRIEQQRLVQKRVCDKMADVEFEKSFEGNKCQRIMTKDVKAFALKYAEENTSQSNDEEIAILKKAESILRRRTLKFMKDNPLKCNDFKVDLKNSQQQIPSELTSFMGGVLFGKRKLDSNESDEREVLTRTLSSSVMYNMKTDRQVSYVSRRKKNARRRYTPHLLAALALSIRHCERNNAVLRLLSAPNIGITIPPRTALLLETMIANAMTKIAEREGVYIPPNMERGIRISCHIDNFDEQVQTFDGKNTVHYLLIVCFQRRVSDFKPIELTLEKTTSLTLKENNFADLLPCDEPSNRQFRRTQGCLNVTPSSGYTKSRSKTLLVWLCLRSMEHLLVEDEAATYISIEIDIMQSSTVPAAAESEPLEHNTMADVSIETDIVLSNILPVAAEGDPVVNDATANDLSEIDIVQSNIPPATAESEPLEHNTMVDVSIETDFVLSNILSVAAEGEPVEATADDLSEIDNVQSNIQPATAESEPQTQTLRWNLDCLKLPSFSATNSLVYTVDTTLTNIFPLPFVAGPASSTSAVFTSLDIAHRTNIVSSRSSLGDPDISDQVDEVSREQDDDERSTADNIILLRPVDPPPAWKTIIVLDLDLYSKAYKLVNSRQDLRNRYILCLGELHIVFAGLRAIGTFIDSSGLDDAWMNANWFDSESLLRQVKDCSNMKRAIATHEATFLAINILILQETLQWYTDWKNEEIKKDIVDTIKLARDSIQAKEYEHFKEAWNRMNSLVSLLNLEDKIKEFITLNKNNRLLQFLAKYCDMVTRLFTFIEATRSRNWLLHLDALEDMIADFASMDRINYRRLSAVYLADMRHLENTDKETWKYFMEGNFCCQKNNIPYTAIGRDHAGEQENKILKGRGGVSGQSSNSNSANRYFMTAPILSQIHSEMLRAGGATGSSPKSHHQLGSAYTQRQNRWVISLLQTFERHKVTLSMSEEEEAFCNIITGQSFLRKYARPRV